MINPMKLYTATDGKTARPVNPYSSNIIHETLKEEQQRREKFYDFEASVQHYPIHSDKPIKGEFWGEVVWQYQHRGSTEWLTCEKTDLKTFEEYSDYMFNNWDCATRQAVQPVPVKGEENDLVGKVIKIPEINITPPSELTDLSKTVWNSAIDACIEAANRLPYKPFLLIEKINSLRK